MRCHHLFLQSTSSPSASVYFGCFVQQLLPNRQGDPDYDPDAESPITDSFCQTGGSNEIIRIINFMPAEQRQLYVNQHTHVASFKNVCHDRGSSFVIVILTLMNDCGSWHALAHIFRMKNPVLICHITSFMQKLSPFVDSRYVTFQMRDIKLFDTTGRELR